MSADGTGAYDAALEHLRRFVFDAVPERPPSALPAVSLFSGAGIGDLGYARAGFRFKVHVEIDPRRAAIGQANFPGETWIAADVRKSVNDVVSAYERAGRGERLALLVATPPCQGMSSSNPSRGRRKDSGHRVYREKNELALQVLPVVRALQPRIVVIENVRQLRTLPVGCDEGEDRSIVEILRDRLSADYHLFDGSVELADFGIAQSRRRAIIVAVSNSEPCLRLDHDPSWRPWPRPTHGPQASGGVKHLTLGGWLATAKYPPLDSLRGESLFARDASHPLHFVPTYQRERYRLIADIPPRSGRSAYENDTCPHCQMSGVPLSLGHCPDCDGILFNRPVVVEAGRARLIRGFKSSYRRMRFDLPAPTVTTASGHLGSDSKIHPVENRLLSLLESADLQTIPRNFDWSTALRPAHGKPWFNVVRDVVGEAWPPYFTYRHGLLLRELLSVELPRTGGDEPLHRLDAPRDGIGAK